MRRRLELLKCVLAVLAFWILVAVAALWIFFLMTSCATERKPVLFCPPSAPTPAQPDN